MATQAPNVQKSAAERSRAGLISVNNLNYNLSSDLSVAVSRSFKMHFAHSQTYAPGQRCIIVANSGAEYVDGRTSFLQFTITHSNAQALGLGNGSGINFIKRLLISSRSGDELERIENLNLFCANHDRLMYSTDHLAKTLSPAGYCETGYTFSSTSDTKIPANTPTTFFIPLKQISPLFAHDRLLPSMLMSGCRIELELAPIQEACKWQIAAPGAMSDYVCSNVTLGLDSYQLSDSIQRLLNQASASSGLEIPYVSIHNSSSSTSATSDSANIEVRKAVSRALSAHCMVRTPVGGRVSQAVPIAAGREDQRDSFALEPFDVSGWQARVGSSYFPQQRVSTADPVDAAKVAFYYQARCFGHLTNAQSAPAISYRDFNRSWSSPGSTDDASASCGFISVDLERSTVIALSGVPINNSRTLEFNLKFYQPAARQIDVFLKYLKLARVFLSNVSVEE